MILNPAILALITASLVTNMMLLSAGWYGGRILASWDRESGSELQLSLERRTYLVSTMVAAACCIQLGSLFLFIHTADNLHGLFSGAMCAAGSLNVNRFGYPTLLVQLAAFLLSGLWLMVNHVDTKGYDYPLIKVKYRLLLVMLPLVLLEAYFQLRFFGALKADIITSCCGSLFSKEQAGIAGDLAGLPGIPSAAVFATALAATFGSGLVYLRKGKGAGLFSMLSCLTLASGLAALIALFCLYFYEIPTHHCPFCLLQREYGYVGYLLYATLLGGGVMGMGPGVLAPFRNRSSLGRELPEMQRRLVLATLCCYLLFAAIVMARVLTTSFRLS